MLVFARMAGPEAAGDYALAAAFVVFLAPFAEAGISQAVVQARTLRSEQMATLTWVSLAIGIVICSLLWLAAPLVGDWYGRPDLAGLLICMSLMLLVTPFGVQQGGLMVRDFRFDWAAKIEVGASLVGFALLVVLLIQDWGAWAMAVSFVVRNSLAAFACYWVSRRQYPVNLLKTSRLKEVWPLLRFGGLDLSARWADFLANYLDKLIIGRWLGTTALGYYQLAFSLCVLPTARLGYIITRVSYPVFAKVRNDAPVLQAHFEQVARDVILLLFPVYIGIALFAQEIISLLYGPAWMPAAPLLVLLAVAGLIRSLNAVFPQLTKGIGRPGLMASWMLLWALCLVLFLTAFLFFDPTIESATWSRLVAKCSVEIFLLFGLARFSGVQFAPVFGFATKLFLYLLPIAGLVLAIDIYLLSFWWALFLKVLLFCIGLLVVGWGTPLKSNVQQLSSLWRNKR